MSYRRKIVHSLFIFPFPNVSDVIGKRRYMHAKLKPFLIREEGHMCTCSGDAQYISEVDFSSYNLNRT